MPGPLTFSGKADHVKDESPSPFQISLSKDPFSDHILFWILPTQLSNKQKHAYKILQVTWEIPLSTFSLVGNSQGTTLYNEDAFLVFLKSDGARCQSDACKTYTVCSVSTWTVSFLSSEFPSAKRIALNILRTHLICELSWSQPSRFGCRIKLIRVIMVWMHLQCFWTSTNFKSSLWDTSLDAEKPLQAYSTGSVNFPKLIST